MVRRADAPPPGWYPDPRGGPGLLWWDGLDWTRHRRPRPTSLETEAAASTAADAAAGGSRSGGELPTATQLRSRASAARGRRDRSAEEQVAAAAAEARRVAKAEVEKAVADARRQLGDVQSRWLPRIDDYRNRIRRWSRVAIVVVVLFVALSAWTTATMQMGVLEWLGERIDAITATATVDGRSPHVRGVDFRASGPLR